MPGQPPNPSLVGSTIQNKDSSTPVSYQISDWLRSTGVVDTYLAAHVGVAIKIEMKHFNPVFTALAGFAERFKQNIKPLVTLNVSSVIKVYDYGVDNSRYFVVVEYHKSPTLRARLESETRLPLATAVEYVREMGETLNEAASAGVLHGLLAPESITLTSKRGPLIGDIGLAAIFADNLARVLAKTPQISAYAAPELVMGQALTASHDIYALTSLLYEMTTGQLPYPNATPFQVGALPIPNPASMDRALLPLMAVIQRGLAKDPAERFQSYPEFDAALREAVAPPAAARVQTPAPAVAEPPPPAPRIPAPPPAVVPKPQTVEDDFAGRTMSDMPVFNAPPPPAARIPTPPPAVAPKPQPEEEDFAGRTVADMPVVSAPPPPAARIPTPPPAVAPKPPPVEEDFAGRTMSDMLVVSAPPPPAARIPTPPPAVAPKPSPAIQDKPIVVVQPPAPVRPPVSSSRVVVPPEAAAKAAAKRSNPPPPAPAAAQRAPTPPPTPPPAAQPASAPAEPNFSARTMLEMPAFQGQKAPPVVPPSFNTAPPSSASQSDASAYSQPTMPPGSASVPPQSAVQYNFGSVPPSYPGAQVTTPRQLDQRYSTSVMNRADIGGGSGSPSSGVTGFLTAYKGEKDKTSQKRKVNPLLVIILLIVVLLIVAGIAFVVLKATGTIG